MRAGPAVTLLMVSALAVVAARAEIDPGSRCAAARLKAAARKAGGKLACHARATARAMPVDPACLARVEARFSATWARIDAVAGCATSTDEATIEATVDTFVTDVTADLRPCGEVDGVCGGACPPTQRCFAIGLGCRGEPEPCRCHGSTTTCPPTTSTSTTLP